MKRVGTSNTCNTDLFNIFLALILFLDSHCVTQGGLTLLFPCLTSQVPGFQMGVTTPGSILFEKI